MATILELNTITLPLDNEDILHIFQNSSQEDKKIPYGTLKEAMTGNLATLLSETDTRLSNGIQSVNNSLTSLIQTTESSFDSKITTETQRATTAESTISGNLATVIGDDENKSMRQVAREVSATVYTPKGSVSFSDLPSLSDVEIGWVYNVTTDFVTTSDFREGAGIAVIADTNIVCAEDSGTKRWDLFGGKLDLSPYQTKALSSPVIVDGTNKTTVESALSAINNFSIQNKESFLKASGTSVVMYPSESNLPSVIDFDNGVVVAVGTVAWCVAEKTWHKVASVNANTLAVTWETYDPHIQADIDLSQYKKIFVGTQEEWNQLSLATKNSYDEVHFIDDENGTAVTDTVANGDMRAVTSNAVYTVTKQKVYHSYSDRNSITLNVSDLSISQYFGIKISCISYGSLGIFEEYWQNNGTNNLIFAFAVKNRPTNVTISGVWSGNKLTDLIFESTATINTVGLKIEVI